MGNAGNLVGTCIGERYDLLEVLGEGGMGSVFRALDRELDELIALKLIRADLLDEPTIVERFRTEVRLARRVTHPNVARTFELGRTGELLYYTMELIEGESLANQLRRVGRLPVVDAIAIACAVCDGLSAAHAAGVIHRDIKPENVMLSNDRVVVSDFGIAAAVLSAADASGTPRYMAPEQVLGLAPTPATDVYALGLLLFEMITGTPAFDGEADQLMAAKHSVEHVLVPQSHGVDAGLVDVIASATARDLDRRIRTAAALRSALARWLPPEPLRMIRSATDAGVELVSIEVRPPRGDSDRMYIAEAVHAELLHRLARTPRVRVCAHSAVEAAITVELIAGDDLSITSESPQLALRVPLTAEQVSIAAEAAAAAIIAALAPRPMPGAALDMLLRARRLAQAGVARLSAGIDLIEGAALLAPDSPLVAAMLAVATVQQTFFGTDGDVSQIERAARSVRAALANGPELAESHLAAGHLELHTGDAVHAAAHFRVAIARAPQAAAAHEQLGRMLLEAGHLEAGFARLTDALEIAPQQRSARWEIARARALLGDWTEHDRILAEPMAPDVAVLSRIRFTLWRDVAYARDLRAQAAAHRVFEPELFDALFAVACDGAWPTRKPELLAAAFDTRRPSRRLRALVAQLVAEAAGFAGDASASEHAVEHAIAQGLFDLHWLDHCRALALVRERERFGELREHVKRRADAILDALYGDHALGAFEATQYASLPDAIATRTARRPSVNK